MWFKNLQVFRLPAPWGIGKDALTAQLERGLFRRCPAYEPSSRGWMARPNGDLVHVVGGQWLICLAVEERLLPASVINDEVAKRAAAMEENQGYAPRRKQLRELREGVTAELLPRAFTRQRGTFVWLDPINGWCGIDAASQAKAEEVIEHLRYCLDDFPFSPLNTQRSPQSAMADWLAGGYAPAGFSIDRDCALQAVAEEKSAVAYKRHPLGEETGGEIREHLAAGKLPTRLALTWNDRISFVLTDRLEIKRLAFLDLVKEEAKQNAEHAAEQFDADFAMMTGEFTRFLPALVAALGGEWVAR